MSRRITTRALAVLSLWAGFGIGTAAALPPAPKADEMAGVQPRQPGVTVATLQPADLARCTVQPYPNAQQPVGYVLADAAGRPVRRFVAVGSQGFNILSFYQDGAEVYRETDSKGVGKIDQYRWLGGNGGKIGYDLDGNGSIDSWDTLSPEELSREVFEAVLRNDPRRLQALLPTVDELKGLGLPQAEIDKIMGRAGNAAKRMQDTAAALKLTDKARWVHLELWAPETTPFDAFGGKADVVRHRNAGVLVDKGDGKTVEVFQLGELVQIGKGWRLIDGPAPGSPTPPQPGGAEVAGGPQTTIPEKVREDVAKLQGLKPDDYPARAAALEGIVTKLQGDAGQSDWVKQLLDAYAGGAEGGDAAAGQKLVAWKKQIDQFAPKSPLAGYAAFRTISADYATRLKAADTPAKIGEVQKWFRESLDGFVKDYPNIDETPEALFRLAMASEFAGGRDAEAAAKGHYATLAKGFAGHPLAAQAQGAVRRLDSEGQPFALAGPNLVDGSPLNVASLGGKVVIVYFWASWSGQLKNEAAALTELMKKHNAKGLEVITVCLDQDPKTAVAAINATSLPGLHMFQPGGGLAAQWGVMGPHVFVVGKDGKVSNKNAQVPLLGDEVEKLLK